MSLPSKPEANSQKKPGFDFVPPQVNVVVSLYGLLRALIGHSSSILAKSFQCAVLLKQCEERVLQGQTGPPRGVTNGTFVVQNSRLMRYIKARVKCPPVSDRRTCPLPCRSPLVN